MRRRTAAALTLPSMLALALAGCSGSTEEYPGETGPVTDQSSQAESPEEWAQGSCPLSLATTNKGNIFALTQGALSPLPEKIDVEGRAIQMGMYTIDKSSGVATKVAEMDSETVFCYQAARAEGVVEGVEEISGETIRFFPVTSPEHGEVYLTNFADFNSYPAGLRFSASSMELEDEMYTNLPYALASFVNVTEQDVQGAEETDVNACNLRGSHCM
ncbi:hypothetical protein ACF3NT_14230 [Naumannella halotolerans]|uniref:Lipoprotein n=1 Tax=Naumannella halotolerans TaxID=993414 RepID=A0A4V3EML0_9ACTN|nr:hypothetical protein [Naumannella halotolerans]TDT29828.1 hypothetical protein CLV29_2847 [Naumannella halotolerans]